MNMMRSVQLMISEGSLGVKGSPGASATETW